MNRVKSFLKAFSYVKRMKKNRFRFRNAMTLAYHNAVVGQNLSILGKIRISGKSYLEIGDNVTIISDLDENPSSGANVTYLALEGGKLIIHSGVGISNSVLSVFDKVEICENASIGSGCMITDSDFHSLNLQDRKSGDTGAKHAPVRICEGAFIGARTIILKGVTIGEESVIGAGAIVTKNVPSKEIWTGNPADFVRKMD